MDHMFSLNESYEYLWNAPNKKGDHETVDSGFEEEPPFLNFPSPFLDEISTTPIPENHQQHHLRVSDKPLDRSNGTTSDPSLSETKCVKQRRNAGKKDRHSKIHTAQGFRDRRMRLSLEIARKFFDLQDLLGFDKASKTIEWLFCKSNKAIKEVMESSNSQYTNQSMSEEIERSISPLSECEVESTTENTATTNKGGNLRGQSRKRTQSNPLARETREKARARARERTRGRMMIKDLKKSEQLFAGNCNDDFDKLGLGFSESPNNHNMEELGYSSSSLKMIHQDTWSSSLEYSHTHHLLRQLQLANSNQSLENCFGSSSTDCSIFINHKKAADPPAGWLNSSNRFMGLLGEWDAENFIMEYNDNRIVPNVAAIAGNIHGQNPSPNSISASNVLHFQYENQGK